MQRWGLKQSKLDAFSALLWYVGSYCFQTINKNTLDHRFMQQFCMATLEEQKKLTLLPFFIFVNIVLLLFVC